MSATVHYPCRVHWFNFDETCSECLAQETDTHRVLREVGYLRDEVAQIQRALNDLSQGEYTKQEGEK